MLLISLHLMVTSMTTIDHCPPSALRLSDNLMLPPSRQWSATIVANFMSLSLPHMPRNAGFVPCNTIKAVRATIITTRWGTWSPLFKCREVSQPEIQQRSTVQTNSQEMWEYTALSGPEAGYCRLILIHFQMQEMCKYGDIDLIRKLWISLVVILSYMNEMKNVRIV